MSKLPSWFLDIKKESEVTVLPSWFFDIHKPDKVEEAQEETLELPRTKAREGNFTTQLMSTIRDTEAPRFGYDSWYGRGTRFGPIAPPKLPTQMTLNEVLEWQNTHNPLGPETTAIGAYQIVNQPNAPTLSGLIRKMGLTGGELFTSELQDRMAIVLMEGRGLSKFLSGKLDGDSFANQIAREWASLPVLKEDRRGRRTIAIGQSYYRGDGINKAFKGPKRLEVYRELYSLADRSIGE